MDVPGYALVTGTASGIGKAVAAAFARDGAAGVALLDRDEASLAGAKQEIEKTIVNIQNGAFSKQCVIRTYAVDVTDEEQVFAAVNNAAQAFGSLDYVVNVAGIAMKHQGGTAFAETLDWRRILDINLTGTSFIVKAAAQIMLKQEPIRSSIDGRPLQRGSIVNFGSIQAVVGIDLSTAYTTSKHAVLGLTRTASEDYQGWTANQRHLPWLYGDTHDNKKSAGAGIHGEESFDCISYAANGKGKQKCRRCDIFGWWKKLFCNRHRAYGRWWIHQPVSRMPPTEP